MMIQELHLEMTRNCTLCCEHCLRGDKQVVNISKETIDNVFNDVSMAYNLLLTGGEPLIAINELEYLVQVLKQRNVRIGKITLVTNGTIMSARVLRLLKEMCRMTYCKIDISSDIFHIEELKRLGFLELRNKNFEMFKNLFGSEQYGKYYEKKTSYLSCVGRAELLSQERLAELNSQIEGEYIVSPGLRTMGQPNNFIQNNCVYGYVPVDVYGNIVSYGQSFIEEDEESKRLKTNINSVGFSKALGNFIDYLNSRNIIAAKVPDKILTK